MHWYEIEWSIKLVQILCNLVFMIRLSYDLNIVPNNKFSSYIFHHTEVQSYRLFHSINICLLQLNKSYLALAHLLYHISKIICHTQYHTTYKIQINTNIKTLNSMLDLTEQLSTRCWIQHTNCFNQDWHILSNCTDCVEGLGICLINFIILIFQGLTESVSSISLCIHLSMHYSDIKMMSETHKFKIPRITNIWWI